MQVLNMLMICFFQLKTSWDYYYPDNAPPEVNYTFTESSNKVLINGNNSFYVSDCFFYDVSEKVISSSLTEKRGKALIEFTTFKNCTSPYYRPGGGCICLVNYDFVMNKCCGVRCNYVDADLPGQFAYIESCSINKVLDSSISLSYEESTGSEATLYLEQGNIVVNTVNISYNQCSENTAFLCVFLQKTKVLLFLLLQ